MAWSAVTASGGTVIRMRCPRCGEVQARARKPLGSRYRCRKCHALFTKEEGVKSAKGEQ